jgi:DNA-binding transcriptional regulator YdaS (Cro superfamily)
MNLRRYLQAARGRTQRLAEQLDVSGSLVTQWGSGKPVSVERCGEVELATANQVRRWDLRPRDWHRIWPELIGAEGAPEVPEPVTQPGALDEVRDAA